MFLIADAPANTISYMIAGYAVIFGVTLIYLISLFIRNRSLKQDIEALNELESKEQ